MAQTFFEKPILNSPYRYPARHWELDTTGQPTDTILPERRKCAYVTPVPKAKKSKSQDQAELAMEAPGGITVDGQTYDPRSIINEVRSAVDSWRKIPDAKNWGVTPETARLLQHWRHHEFNGLRPFFCQVEAVETAIWLTEVAPKQPQYKNSRNTSKPPTPRRTPPSFASRSSSPPARARPPSCP